MQLEKAKLQAIKADGSPDGDPIPVQFNPSSLRLQISNQTEGGESRGRQVRQYNGSSSTTLTVDLIFDTADEGTTDAPRSVREKTSQVEQFVYPRGEGDNKQAPPKLRFEWGDLVLEGVVESLSIDLDHFAANGIPLRAKVGFSFKEQDRKFELLASGPGANSQGNAPAPGQPALGMPGSIGIGVSAQIGVAIGGESAAEFAARVGIDPAAWRGLSFEGSSGGSLSLDAGLEVGFSASLNASAGLGVTTGASAGASASLAGSFGLEPSRGASASSGTTASPEAQQNFTLATAGGVGAAIQSVKMASSTAAARQSVQAFASASASVPPSTPPKPSKPDQSRAPLMVTGMPSPASQQAAPSAPPPPAADPRTTSFGFGVPLRPTVGQAVLDRSSALTGNVPLDAKTGKGNAPTTNDPTTPPWVALPPARLARSGSREQATRPKAPCGCGE